MPYTMDMNNETHTMVTGQYLVCCPKLDEREYVMGMYEAAEKIERNRVETVLG